MQDPRITGETREEYEQDAKRYFKNLGDAKRPGPSADDTALAESALPPDEQKHRILDRFAKGFNKTSRSGSFTDKPNSSPAIFPNGLKFASDFIDEHTPGKFKPEAPAKPPETQKKPTGHFPKAVATIDDICLDCMGPVDPKEYVGAIYIITERDTQKCFSMGVKFGDIVLNAECKKCFDIATSEAKNTSPLVLVFGGQLTSEEDIKLAQRFRQAVYLHDGQEKTAGQWHAFKRRDRLQNNLERYLMAADKSSKIFVKNRELILK